MKGWTETLKKLTPTESAATRLVGCLAGRSMEVGDSEVSLGLGSNRPLAGQRWQLELIVADVPVQITFAPDVHLPWFAARGVDEQHLSAPLVRHLFLDFLSQRAPDKFTHIGWTSDPFEFQVPLTLRINGRPLPLQVGLVDPSDSVRLAQHLRSWSTIQGFVPMDRLPIPLEMKAATVELTLDQINQLEVGDWIAVD